MKLQNYTYTSNMNGRVSFQAMKKSQFDGIDFAVVEKYKAPIEKFNTHDDFQNWAKEECYEVLDRDLGGRNSTIAASRNRMQDEWEDQLKKDGRFTPAEQLVILNGIVSGVKPTNDTLLPAYSRQVLGASMSEVEAKLKQDKFYQFNFGNIYRQKLRNFYMDGNTEFTGWVKIPSRDHDRENFDDNVKRLVALSSPHWCTKANHALSYLADGDFHIYFDKGAPKIGLRIIDDGIEEIEDDLNRRVLPPDYFNILKDYVEENDYQICGKAQNEYKASEQMSEGIEQAQKKLGSAIEECDAEKILNYVGIDTKRNKDGKLIISHYNQPKYYTFADLGVNEDKMFEQISKIKGDAIFANSGLSSLGNLKEIEGNADFSFSKITDLGELRNIAGSADFRYASTSYLGNLKNIGGNVNFSYSSVHDLGGLEYIGGNANFHYSNVTEMGDLYEIGGDANFSSTIMTSLGGLNRIGGNALFGYTKLEDFGDLREIGGNATFVGIKVPSLNPLRTIGGNLDIQDSIIESLGSLKKIGGNLKMLSSKVYYCPRLEKIGGEQEIVSSEFPDIRKAEEEESKPDTFHKIMNFLKNL